MKISSSNGFALLWCLGDLYSSRSAASTLLRSFDHWGDISIITAYADCVCSKSALMTFASKDLPSEHHHIGDASHSLRTNCGATGQPYEDLSLTIRISVSAHNRVQNIHSRVASPQLPPGEVAQHFQPE